MRIARFSAGGDPAYGFVQTEGEQDYLAVVQGDPLFMKSMPTGASVVLVNMAAFLLFWAANTIKGRIRK